MSREPTRPIIGFMNEKGEMVSEPFDPNNPRHRAFLEEQACDCPLCQELFDSLSPPLPGLPGTSLS